MAFVVLTSTLLLNGCQMHFWCSPCIQWTRLAFYGCFFWGVLSSILSLINSWLCSTDICQQAPWSHMSPKCHQIALPAGRHRKSWWGTVGRSMWEQSVLLRTDIITFTHKLFPNCGWDVCLCCTDYISVVCQMAMVLFWSFDKWHFILFQSFDKWHLTTELAKVAKYIHIKFTVLKSDDDNFIRNCLFYMYIITCRIQF